MEHGAWGMEWNEGVTLRGGDFAKRKNISRIVPKGGEQRAQNIKFYNINRSQLRSFTKYYGFCGYKEVAAKRLRFNIQGLKVQSLRFKAQGSRVQGSRVQGSSVQG